MIQQGAYLATEIALLAFILAIKPRGIPFRLFVSRRFLAVGAALFLVWMALDLVAVSLGLWSFPTGGTLDFRFLGLPIEEYAMFFIHTVVCTVFLGVVTE
jgi:lycopene cyclase domain-containing protein